MTGPLYSSVIVAHVLAAVVGFGALGATGSYAAGLRRCLSSAPAPSPSTLRYFRPGRNWAARSILLVPVLGATLLVLGHGRDLGRAYPWIGLGLWLSATAVASGVMWPAEREIQDLVAPPARTGASGGLDAETDPGRAEVLASACLRCERAAAVTSVLFVAALVVMIAQP